jgi:hypothetical protein
MPFLSLFRFVPTYDTKLSGGLVQEFLGSFYGANPLGLKQGL